MDLTGCTRNCGGGQKERYRICDSPSPSNGGSQCSGQSQKTVPCNTHQCNGMSFETKINIIDSRKAKKLKKINWNSNF